MFSRSLELGSGVGLAHSSMVIGGRRLGKRSKLKNDHEGLVARGKNIIFYSKYNEKHWRHLSRGIT